MQEYNSIIFKDRRQGGKKLAERLQKLDLQDPIILAIPSGGVPVGKAVAEKLGIPFDLLVVRKIKHPLNPEAGIGSVTADGQVLLNQDVVESLYLDDQKINQLAGKTIEQVRRREKKFRDSKEKPNLEDRTVILVDDGLASGFTMLAAVKSVKSQNPKKTIVAVPTASESGVERVEDKVDKLISVYTHPKEKPFAVASSYQHWHDLSDEEVLAMLE